MRFLTKDSRRWATGLWQEARLALLAADRVETNLHITGAESPKCNSPLSPLSDSGTDRPWLKSRITDGPRLGLELAGKGYGGSDDEDEEGKVDENDMIEIVKTAHYLRKTFKQLGPVTR